MKNNFSSSHINHYIITRFNIILNNQVLNNAIDKINVRTEASYLEYRFSLFEEYTFPSMKNQTNQNFSWIVLFSDETPTRFKKRIDYLKSEMPNFRPIFLSLSDDLHLILSKIFLDERTGVLVTSRLDNDDALSVNYVEVVQENVKNDGKIELLVFPQGVQYDARNRIMARYNFSNNHFSTLICGRKDINEMVLDCNHMKSVKLYDSRHVAETGLMWMEVIHGGNILNSTFLSFSSLIFKFSILTNFGYMKSVIPCNRWKAYLMVMINQAKNTYQILSNHGTKKFLNKIVRRARA